jgi:hypothetical protein
VVGRGVEAVGFQNTERGRDSGEVEARNHAPAPVLKSDPTSRNGSCGGWREDLKQSRMRRKTEKARIASRAEVEGEEGI